MPIPSPVTKESKNEFISRCMGDNTMNKEYEQKQRYAICLQKWEDKKKTGSATMKTPTDEIVYFLNDKSSEILSKNVQELLDP